MSPPRPRWGSGQASDAVWLGLALVIGALLRFWQISAASLYSDEAFTFDVSRQSIPALLRTLAQHDFHPPLFYVACHGLMAALHWPLSHYRVFTALCGLVSIVATWGFARRCAGAWAAAIAAMTVALWPALVQYDRLFRMHALAVALCALSWWFLAEATCTRRARAWPWLGYALVIAALAYTDYLGLLVIGLQCAFAISRPRVGWPVFAAVAMVALLYIPWVGSLRAQFPLGGLAASRPALDPSLLASIRAAFVGDIPDGWLRLAGFDGFVTALIVLLGAGGMWLVRSTPLPFWLALLPLQIAMSIVLGKNLAYFPRYLLMVLPAFAAALGCVVGYLLAVRRVVPAVLLGTATLALLAFGSGQLLSNAYYQFPDWYAVDALLVTHAHPEDAILLDAGYELEVVREYRGFRGHTLLVFMNPSDFAPLERWLAQHPQRRVWYIEHQNFYWDPQHRLEEGLRDRKELLEWTEPRQSATDAVRVVLFERMPMTKAR